MIVPDEDTNVRGMLLLCDLVDSGDLEGAMGKDYRGVLYARDSKWPLASVTLQIYVGFEHMHERGIIHQVRVPLEQNDICKSMPWWTL